MTEVGVTVKTVIPSQFANLIVGSSMKNIITKKFCFFRYHLVIKAEFFFFSFFSNMLHMWMLVFLYVIYFIDWTIV